MKEKIKSFFHSPSFAGGDSHADVERSISPREQAYTAQSNQSPANQSTANQSPDIQSPDIQSPDIQSPAIQLPAQPNQSSAQPNQAAASPPSGIRAHDLTDPRRTAYITSVDPEQLDLRLASAENPTVVMELDLDCNILHVSKSWETLVGTRISHILNRPLSNIIIGNTSDDLLVFNKAVERMIMDNASYKVKFLTATNLRKSPDDGASDPDISERQSPDPGPQSHFPANPSGLGNQYGQEHLPGQNPSGQYASGPEYSGSQHSSGQDYFPGPDNLSQHNPLPQGNSSEQLGCSDDPNRSASPQSLGSTSSGNLEEQVSNDGGVIELEAQGILILSPSTKLPTRSIWTIRPFVRIEMDLTIPPALVDLLGFGSEIFEGYLVSMQESGIIDEHWVPEPKTILCRICESNIPAWFIEKHSDFCFLEHKTEDDLQFYHDAIADQRELVSRIYESLWYAQFDCSGPPTPGSSSSSISSSSSMVSFHDYKGFPLPSPTPEPMTPSSRHPSVMLAPRPMSSSASTKSSKKFPFGILQKLLDYCDEALLINPAERSEETGVFTFSPTTESAIDTVVNWQPLETSDPAIRAMVDDSKALIMEKVNHLTHLISLLQYSDKIKQEVDELVLASVKSTVQKIREKVQESTSQSVSFSGTRSRALSLGKQSRSHRISSPSARSDLDEKSESLDSRMGNLVPEDSPSMLISSPSLIGYDGALQSPQPARGKGPHFLGEAFGMNDSQAPTTLTPIDILSNPNYRKPSPVKNDSASGPDLIKDLTDSLEHLDMKPSGWASTHSSLSSPRRRLSPAPYVEKVNLSTLQKNTIAQKQETPSRKSSSDFDSLQFSRDNAPSGLAIPMAGATSIVSNSSSGSQYSTPVSQQRNSMSSAKPPLSPLLVSQPSNSKASSGGIKDYEIIKAISKGAFGSVFLARRRLTGDYVAIKCLRKRDMIAKNQVLNVRAERAVMMTQADSPFVAQLYSSFQTKDYLYLVMEYLNGGDCATLLKMLGTLGDKWSKRYIAEVIVGVNDLHRRNIIHRDLKPDNILIDGKGHMKLTDFGLSKIGVVGRQTYSHRKSSASEHAIELFRKNVLNSSTVQSPLVYNTAIDSPELTPSTHKRTSSVTPFSLTPSTDKPPSSSSHDSASAVFAAKRRSRSHFMTGSTRSGSNSSGVESPNLNPLLHRTPSDSSFAIVDDEFSVNSPHEEENIHSFALYDPTREGNSGAERFCGTPDYLAPEIILGECQGEYSDWWSIGCIFFEFLFGYPPFHAETPEKVFKNILAGDIDWPPLSEEQEREICPPEAKDLIKKLLTSSVEDRLGFNGAEEIMRHPYFSDVNWDTLYDEAPDSFVPTLDGPESTDYFDLRGADISQFPKDDFDEDDDKHKSSTSVDSGDHLSLPSTPGSAKRERRGSKLSDPTEFGSFHFRNLNVLEKANKDVINRLKSEHLEHRNSFSSSSSDSFSQPSISKSRGSSVSSGKVNLGSPFKRPVSPLLVNPGSPGKSSLQYRVKKKFESSPSTFSNELRSRSSAPSLSQRLLSKNATESLHSPPSSDNEDSSSALYRVRKRRESMMHSHNSGRDSPQPRLHPSPVHDPRERSVWDLDVLYCEPIAIVRHTVSKLLEKHGCVVLAISDGDDLVRRATSQVKFDMIFTALRLTKVEAVDAVKLIKYTSGVNSETPVVAITGFSREALDSEVFDEVLEKPVSSADIRLVLGKFAPESGPGRAGSETGFAVGSQHSR